jgi:hypothetical protein
MCIPSSYRLPYHRSWIDGERRKRRMSILPIIVGLIMITPIIQIGCVIQSISTAKFLESIFHFRGRERIRRSCGDFRRNWGGNRPILK